MFLLDGAVGLTPAGLRRGAGDCRTCIAGRKGRELVCSLGRWEGREPMKRSRGLPLSLAVEGGRGACWDGRMVEWWNGGMLGCGREVAGIVRRRCLLGDDGRIAESAAQLEGIRGAEVQYQSVVP